MTRARTRRLTTLLCAGAVLASCAPGAGPPRGSHAPAPRHTRDGESRRPSSGEPDRPRHERGRRPPGQPAVVIGVIDGDTIEVSFRGRSLTVRLIGVDTPETVHPFEPVGCFGPAASGFTESFLDGVRVGLEFDAERLDPFGRTLAYVWVERRLFNKLLVARGFATVATFPPNVRYVDRFLSAEREARAAQRGLWGACS